MECSKCKRIVTSNMKFCPYCNESLKNEANHGYDKKDAELRAYLEKKEIDKIYKEVVQGNAYAEYIYIQYMKNNSKDADLELMKKCQNSANVGEASIHCILLLLRKLDSAVQDNGTIIEKCCMIIEQAAEEDDPAALFYMALLLQYQVSQRISCNEIKAYRCMKKSADRDYPEALQELGRWYYNGTNGVTQDQEQGVYLYNKYMHYHAAVEQCLVKKSFRDEYSLEDFKRCTPGNLIINMQSLIQSFAKEERKEKNISKVSGENVEEAELWSKILSCTEVNGLKTLKKEIEEKNTPIDKSILAYWLDKKISAAERIKKEREEEEKLKKEAAEKKKLEEDRDKKLRAPANEIINNCKTEEDFLVALKKLRALRLPKEYADEYKRTLVETFRSKYSTEINRASAAKYAAKDCLIALLVSGGALIVGGLVFFIVRAIVGKIVFGVVQYLQSVDPFYDFINANAVCMVCNIVLLLFILYICCCGIYGAFEDIDIHDLNFKAYKQGKKYLKINEELVETDIS